MKKTAFSTAIALICFLGIFGAAKVPEGFAETLTVRVSGSAAIEEGEIARAQNEAIDAALSRGLETVLIRVISPRAFESLEPLLRARILPRVQDFVTNYQIVNRDVSDLAYTIGLSVTVDKDILNEELAELGVIKGPHSPPLTAVFITVDAPVGLEHVQSFGSLAAHAVSSVLELSGFTVLPAPDGEELGFRLIRPPQVPQVLVSNGRSAMADLSVGVLFRKNGAAEEAPDGGTAIPMEVSLRAVDVLTGDLVGTSVREELVILGPKDGTVLSSDLRGILNWMAQDLSLGLQDRYLAVKEEVTPIELVFEGSHDARSVRIALGEMLFNLGEEADVVPERFTPDRSVYQVWAQKGKEGIASALESSRIVGRIFFIDREEKRLVLREKTDGRGGGVREFRQEVTFYRRLPVAGVENPDDVRKIEAVSWQEAEDNSGVKSANSAPVGEGILGRVDPSGDQDFFRFLLPEGTGRVTVAVEQTGPGEVMPRVRVFGGDGTLLEDQRARARGRNLFFILTLPRETGEVLLCLEDHLGRYPSMFPYVLKVGSGKKEGSGESP